MASAFRRRSGRYQAQFEPDELVVVVMLLEQTRDLLAVPAAEEQRGHQPADEFEHLMRSAGWGDQAPGGAAEAVPLPPDPALQRLLPDPNPTDPQASAEFRRLTGAGLRERKAATLTTAIEALGTALSSPPPPPAGAERSRPRHRKSTEVTVDLDQPQAHAVLMALTDVRLVLGERLELSTEQDADEVVHRLEHSLDPEDPRVAMAFAYDFLTWIQESLTQALLRS